MEPLILAFDVGSQSIRAVLINKTGQSELSAKMEYSPCIPSDVFGRSEQKPDFYYDAICNVSKLLKEKDTSGLLFARIKAVVVTCIRDTMVVIDKDKKPLRNIIVWMDNRRAKGNPKLPLLLKTVLSVVNMKDTITMLYKDAFYNWICENEPQVIEKADKILMLPSYINYQLTGTLKDSVANQIGHIPFDYKNRKWLKKGISRFACDIPCEKLVDIVEPGNVIGTITKETAELSAIPAGLPLIAAGTDKACEALGCSVIDYGKAAISFGTSATVQFCAPKFFNPWPFLPSYPSVIPGYFNGETQIYRGYWTVSWFRDQFCQKEVEEAKKLGIKPEQILDSYLDEVPVGSNGLLMTPHLAPGANNPHARSIFLGMTDRHTKKDMYRAMIEGINYELILCMKNMEKRCGHKANVLYVAGGGSQSDKIMQITVDMFGLPAKRVQSDDASAVGAAMAAFVGTGEFSSYKEACESMVHERDVFYPNEDNYRKYKEIFDNVYRKIEKNNTKLFKKITSSYKN